MALFLLSATWSARTGDLRPNCLGQNLLRRKPLWQMPVPQTFGLNCSLPKPDSAQSISTGRSKANLHRKRTEVFALILVMPGTRTHHGAFLTFCYVVGPNWRSKAKLPRPKLVETQASVADACPENLWPKLLLPKPDSPADLKQNCAGRGRRCLP